MLIACRLILYQLLNVHGQNEMHTAKPLVPHPSSHEVEIAIEKLERYKLFK